MLKGIISTGSIIHTNSMFKGVYNYLNIAILFLSSKIVNQSLFQDVFILCIYYNIELLF